MTEISKEKDWIDAWFDNPDAEKYAMNIIIKRNQQLYGDSKTIQDKGDEDTELWEDL